jgi:hypothetical protein
MLETIGTIVASAVPASIGGFFAGRQQSKTHFREREAGDEQAKTGYRAAWREFILDLDAAQIDTDGRLPSDELLKLRERFYVVRNIGDPPLEQALDAWWPRPLFLQGQLGDPAEIGQVEARMSERLNRSLKEQDAVVRRHLKSQSGN